MSSIALILLDTTYAQSTLEPAIEACRMDGRVTPYAPLREADVMWERRVWRVIDLREKMNLPLLSPQGEFGECPGLFGVIRHGLLQEGAITAYDPGPLAQDDGFKSPFERKAIATLFADLDTLPQRAIFRIMIKEDWIFDRQRSVMEVRIIGLAPMIEVHGADGELRGHRPLFWLYYPECRTLFSRWAALEENGVGFSYEALFTERRFTSTITKVSNMYDRSIDQHRAGLDALIESESIREQLLRMGFDLWNY